MLGGWRLAQRVPPEAWVVGFWSAALALMWTWCAYPLTLLLLTARRRHPASLPADTSSTPQPVMSVVIAAHNEEHVIGQRVDNCLELAWPTDKLEVVVVSDGSTDRTDEIVRGFSDPRVKLVRTDRVGKSLAQNRAIAEARGDVVILSDADTSFDPGFIDAMAHAFADPRVGVANGRLTWTNPNESAVAHGGNAYWRFELWLWRRESQLGVLGWTSGQCMAVRRRIFQPMEPQYGDDVVIPLDAISAGYRVVYCEQALAYEPRIADVRSELRARSRMTLRGLSATASRFGAIRPLRQPGVAAALISHKVLRWLTPYFLATAAIMNIGLLGHPLYRLTGGVQALFYVGAAIGFWADRLGMRLPLCSTAYAFCLMNVGIGHGVARALLRRRVYVYES
jgi:cellulose synthase/poly-beta-1,6-N-acetylglucosamine synthase-like glycosyltransferase